MHAIHAPRIQLDPNRIASISGAIAVNGLLLLLLVAPMAAPVVQPAREEVIRMEIYRKPVVVPPPPRDPPRPVQRETPKPHVVPVTQERVTERPPEREVVVADSHEGDYKGVEGGETVTPPILPPDDGKPMAGAHLEYAEAPAPAYPRDALANNETGSVLLEVLVDVDGRPIEVKVAKSSGVRSLDLAAKRQVLSKWRFKPAMRNGVAVQAIGLVPVDFRLD